MPPTDDYERRYGQLGGRETRAVPITVDEIRDSGAGAGQFTVRGHAAVFDQWSLDLGFFREKIDRAAFDTVLADNPDVWLLWDHDTRWTLARTANKTLELRTDPRGLHYWGRVAPTSYAEDLRVLMERGDINQASFAFTVARDEWTIRTDENGDEQVERVILEVDQLYDVTVTAMGAYSQTDSQVVRAALLGYNPAATLLNEGVEQLAAVEAGVEAGSRDAGQVEETFARLHALRALSRTSTS